MSARSGGSIRLVLDACLSEFHQSLGDFDTERFIYHYTTADNAFKHILPSASLRLGPLATVNDPRESRLLGFTYLPKNLVRQTRALNAAMWHHADNWKDRNVTDQASALLTKRIKIACFSRDARRVPADDLGYYHGYSRPAMWAYYGSNHTGVCLVFERQHLVDEVTRQIGKSGQLFFGNMRYPRRGATLREKVAFNLDLNEIAASDLERYIERKFQHFHAELCLRKHPDWRQESEWRCLFYSADEDFKYVDISTALHGIVLGAGVTIGNWLTELKSIKDRFEIPIIHLEWKSLTGRGFDSPQFMPPSKKNIDGGP